MCNYGKRYAPTRPAGEHSPIPYVSALEEELLEKINCLGIGPGGLGGRVMVLLVILKPIRHILQGFLLL